MVSTAVRSITIIIAVVAVATVGSCADLPPGTSVVSDDGSLYTTTQPLQQPAMWNITCKSSAATADSVPGCSPTACARRLFDDFATEEEVEILLGIAKKGMAGADTGGGPTILDVNSGFMKDTQQLHRIYPGVQFTQLEYTTYATMFDRIRDTIMDSFGLDKLWFTAPTFITRLIGDQSWQPAAEHDVYWTKHVDGFNTEHYDYSGLLYLTTYDEDFTGGRFVFYDEGGRNHTVEPRAGRFLTFTSGAENWHQVRKVETGIRFTMSMWFTCDSSKEFKRFLDGKVHQTFRRPVAEEEHEEL